MATARRFWLKRLTYLLYFILYAAVAQGQAGTAKNSAGSSYPVYALRLHYGVIYAHTKYVENTAGAHPRGFEFEISKQHIDKPLWENYRCYPRMGLILSYFDFNTRILGKTYSAAYFIEPDYRVSKNCSFFLRMGVGLSYLTNPHDSIKNPTNQSYSLPINAYLTAGAGINCNVSPHIALSFMTSFQHNSNGGFELPNHGVNYPTASLGIRYTAYNNSLPVYKREQVRSYRHTKIIYDAGFYYSPKSGYSAGWVSSRKYLAGVFVQASKRVSTLDNITLSLEAYHDGGLASIKKLLMDNTSNNLVGLMIGHEFIFRRILFSQQLGYYIYKDTKTFSDLYQQAFPRIYHRWGLRYKLNPHWYAGFNMLAHNQVADFIDLRLNYRF
ncbi:MAG TPA: acyloxyacyl hydrolase [Chitinophagaceae bacterium]|nr:acyloxyacyl hydrolase [Chitinophagaceae bacterium]